HTRSKRDWSSDVCSSDLNVLGSTLETCGTDPLTGFYRDGCCDTGPEDLGNHTVCAVATSEFLSQQAAVGNELRVAKPQYGFSGEIGRASCRERLQLSERD